MKWMEAFKAMSDDLRRLSRFGVKFFIFEDVTDDVFPLSSFWICEAPPSIKETEDGPEIHLRDANGGKTLCLKSDGYEWSWIESQLTLLRYKREPGENISLEEFCEKEGL